MTTNDEEAAERAAKLYEEWLQDPSTARPLEEVEAELFANDELSDMLTTIRANYVASLERRVAEQREAIAQAVEALEAVEWVQVGIANRDKLFYLCGWCEWDKDAGHAPDCGRQAALAGLRGLQIR